jgi:hypothetical protein
MSEPIKKLLSREAYLLNCINDREEFIKNSSIGKTITFYMDNKGYYGGIEEGSEAYEIILGIVNSQITGFRQELAKIKDKKAQIEAIISE